VGCDELFCGRCGGGEVEGGRGGEEGGFRDDVCAGGDVSEGF